MLKIKQSVNLNFYVSKHTQESGKEIKKSGKELKKKIKRLRVWMQFDKFSIFYSPGWTRRQNAARSPDDIIKQREF